MRIVRKEPKRRKRERDKNKESAQRIAIEIVRATVRRELDPDELAPIARRIRDLANRAESFGRGSPLVEPTIELLLRVAHGLVRLTQPLPTRESAVDQKRVQLAEMGRRQAYSRRHRHALAVLMRADGSQQSAFIVNAALEDAAELYGENGRRGEADGEAISLIRTRLTPLFPSMTAVDDGEIISTLTPYRGPRPNGRPKGRGRGALQAVSETRMDVLHRMLDLLQQAPGDAASVERALRRERRDRPKRFRATTARG